MRYSRSFISYAVVFVLAIAVFAALSSPRASAQEAPCSLIIEKVSVPANGFPFEFEISGDQSGDFILRDPGIPQQLLGLFIDQTITVTELLTPGWEIESIECTEGVTNCGATPCLDITINEDGITAVCLDNDIASCTITNVAAPSNIPTLSEWGLIAMAAVIGAAGIFMALRRRKAAA